MENTLVAKKKNQKNLVFLEYCIFDLGLWREFLIIDKQIWRINMLLIT